MSLIRLVTIHPALVHYTLGTIPVLVLAYALARLRRSERWTFVGDVALWVTAAITVLTGTFGFVSFFVLDWPGGIYPWQWLHLGFGVAVAAGLVSLAIVRARARRTRPLTGNGTLGAALVIGALSIVAGWIGGDVLVFRSGMAVQAAGDGALALPLPGPRAKPPTHAMDAMHTIRPAWAAITASIAAMIVERPRDDQFATIAREARQIETTSDWLEHEGPKTLEKTMGANEAPGIGGGPPEPSGESPQEMFERWGGELGTTAKKLREAAEQRDIRAVTKAAGRMQTTCTGCHDDLRWKD